MTDRPRPSRLTLRTRMVGLAALLVTVVLVVGAALMGVGLRAVLLADLRTTATLRSQELAGLAARGALPQPVPIADPEEALVQVVAGSTVIASSENVRGVPPLDLTRPPVGRTQLATVERLPVEDEDEFGFVVAATTAGAADGPVTVIVALSAQEVGETLADAAALGLAALPLLIAAISAAVWVVVTRTLEPVEGMRAQADAIGGAELHLRVPEPPRLDELGRLARTLNAMLARLQDAAERQSRFVADAAHELRSPIASVRAQVETARGSNRPVSWEQVSAGVLHETARMEQLTEQLLLLARVDARHLELRHDDVDLDDLVDVVTADWRAAGSGPRVDILGVEPVRVIGDRVLLEAVVRNLLDNAHRYARSWVSVGLQEKNGVAVLTVDDDGPGIPTENRNAVFERFRRLDAARDRDSGGTGLGLAIVADVTRAHGGTVSVEASPLGGAHFIVRLPVRRIDVLSRFSAQDVHSGG